jgi:hypothetical protein
MADRSPDGKKRSHDAISLPLNGNKAHKFLTCWQASAYFGLLHPVMNQKLSLSCELAGFHTAP